MRKVVALLVFGGCFANSAAIAQSSGAGACAYLDLELAKRVSGIASAYVFQIPPEEEPSGAGSMCSYADIRMQIDAVSPSFIEQSAASGTSGWEPIDGVGDRTYFHDNRGIFAEIIGMVGTRTFTIQMTVPTEGSVAAVKPNVITLAKDVVAKLK